MILYRVAGLPIALRRRFFHPRRDALDELRNMYARHYWRPVRDDDRKALRRALLRWPGYFLAQMAHYLRLNGDLVARTHGRSVARQIAGQLYYYGRYGILPRWYYIFELYRDDGRARAGGYVHRFMLKAGGLYRQLNRGAKSPLVDKVRFAKFCERHGVRAAPVLAGPGISNGQADLPEADLFMKPVAARGGSGAQRWDHVGDGRYRRTDGTVATSAELLGMVRSEKRRGGRLIQRRLVGHPDLGDLSNGALTTLRILTCLNENNEPEPVAAVFRMAIGKNVTVDNIHAGGIAAAVDLETGRMGKATNLGDDVRLGWFTHHPDTGAQIDGRAVHGWFEARSLAIKAHKAFADRVMVGWDIALLADGPCLVEGNSGPDVDLMQRPLGRGLRRFGELLAFQLKARGC